MKKMYVKEIAKRLDIIDELVSEAEVTGIYEVAKIQTCTREIRAILLTS